jgi:hypothetical protein
MNIQLKRNYILEVSEHELKIIEAGIAYFIANKVLPDYTEIEMRREISNALGFDKAEQSND